MFVMFSRKCGWDFVFIFAFQGISNTISDLLQQKADSEFMNSLLGNLLLTCDLYIGKA